MDTVTETVRARVESTTPLAERVVQLVLRREDGLPFTGIAAGAHVGVALPSGTRRTYSLVNAPGVDEHVMIAVQREEAGRGGSNEACDLRPGESVTVDGPRNHFALDPADEESVLVAGGIGITPIWCMVQHLEAEGRRWQLHYGARSRARAAFLPELEQLEAAGPGRVHLAFSDEDGRLDIPAIVDSAGPGTGVYCCGPQQIVERFREASAHLGDMAHLEDFTVAEVSDGGFEVELSRSGRTLTIADGSSILDAVLEAGVDPEPEYSCMSGTCGTCETQVLDGEPDHRDYFLTDEEKAVGDRMMICCSGSRSARLVLDL